MAAAMRTPSLDAHDEGKQHMDNNSYDDWHTLEQSLTNISKNFGRSRHKIYPKKLKNASPAIAELALYF